jgi:hypothetical protein
MTTKEENDKRHHVANELEKIFLNPDNNWEKQNEEDDLTNSSAGLSKLFVEPVTALHLNEVEKFTVAEDVSGTIYTTFVRKT